MTLYYDEPIRRPASYIPPAEKPALPEPYRKMKALAASVHSPERLFYEQGMLMADYEDDYAFHGTFVRYYPTYQAMNDEQLRGYFSWRTKLRRGDIRKTSLSFVYVYIYELLNQIGVRSPEEGFDTLQRFRKAYRGLDARAESFLNAWMKDYVIYNNLPVSLIPEFDALSSLEEALNTLARGVPEDTETLFAALCALSSYNLCNSRFYKANPSDVAAVCCNVYRRLCEEYDAHKKCSYFQHLFGTQMVFPRKMFSFAIFYDHKHYISYEYKISDTQKYHCSNGRWSFETYPSIRKKNTELGLILKSVDAMLRQACHDSHPLEQPALPAETSGLIRSEIEAFLAEKKRLAAPRIDIDLSRLSDIRSAAAQTRDRLMTEAEMGEDEPLPATPAFADTVADASAAEGTASVLNENERRFLRCLLEKEPYQPLLRELSIPLSIMVDTVNEKLFDLFQDTPVLFEADTPVLIDDYMDELKGLLL